MIRNLFQGGLYLLLARALVMLVSIPIHEYAHAWTAWKMGDDTALSRGRLSFNPLDHLDPIGLLVFILTGFGWARPVPVNTSRMNSAKKGLVLVALAGPVSNILLALAVLIVYKLLGILFMLVGTSLLRNALIGPLTVLNYMVISNLYLAVFNLLPIPPLDGWRIASSLLPPKLYWEVVTHEQQISLVLFVLVFTGILSRPISFFAQLLYNLLELMTFFL